MKRAASALNRPAIVHIYEIDEAVPLSAQGHARGERLLYIAMEHIDGQTLREQLQRPVDLKSALEWFVQLETPYAKRTSPEFSIAI